MSDQEGGASRTALKLSQQLVMTPQLQLAIKLLATPTTELAAMIGEWRAGLPEPVELIELVAGEPDPLDAAEAESAAENEQDAWYPLAEPPVPSMTAPVDVWVFGNPPQARANAFAYPRYRSPSKDGVWIARSLRQRAKTFEKVIGALVERRPQIAVSTDPDKVEKVAVRDIAEAIGMHESTVTRVASAVRFHNLHGVIGLTGSKKIGFRGL